MCCHIYDWNIVDCDIKQPISLTRSLLQNGVHTLLLLWIAENCPLLLLNVNLVVGWTIFTLFQIKFQNNLQLEQIRHWTFIRIRNINQYIGDVNVSFFLSITKVYLPKKDSVTVLFIPVHVKLNFIFIIFKTASTLSNSFEIFSLKQLKKLWSYR